MWVAFGQDKTMLTESNEWKRLISEQDATQRLLLRNALVQKLTADDVESLVSTFVGSTDEVVRYAASDLLLAMLQEKDSRLPSRSHGLIANAAKEIVRDGYPQSRLSTRSFVILEILDAPAAEQLIVSFDPTNFKGSELVLYIWNLEHLKTPSTIAKLRELEQLGGDLGRRANQALANLGMLSESQIAEIAAQFRKDRSTPALNRIFNVYVRFRIGSRLDSLRQLLGDPSREEPHCLIYQTDKPFAEIKIWFNEKGIITDVWSR